MDVSAAQTPVDSAPESKFGRSLEELLREANESLEDHAFVTPKRKKTKKKKKTDMDPSPSPATASTHKNGSESLEREPEREPDTDLSDTEQVMLKDFYLPGIKADDSSLVERFDIEPYFDFSAE